MIDYRNDYIQYIILNLEHDKGTGVCHSVYNTVVTSLSYFCLWPSPLIAYSLT